MKHIPPFKFAILSYFPDFADLMHEFNNSLEYTLDYHMIRYDSPDLGASELFEKGYEVILFYSVLFDSIKNLGYSCVHIQKTDMDIIKAILKAKTHANMVGIVAHTYENIDIQLLEDICDIPLKKIEYTTAYELQSKLKDAIAEGCHAIVGGGLSHAITKQYTGIASFPVKPSHFSLRLALERAKVIAKIKREERLRHDQLFSVLKVFSDGVVVIDENKQCVYHNKNALQLISPGYKISSKQLKQYYGQLFLEEALKQGSSFTDEQVTIHGRHLLVSTIPLFVDANRRGAVAFLRDVASLYDLTGRVRASQKKAGVAASSTIDDLLGNHPSIKRLKHLITTFAPHDASVLIHGETGSGKDLVAQALHNASRRKNGPFWAINCAAIQESLLESELFGYEGGAFTGAKRAGKAGMFELAHGGTLFLDEVGELSPGAQSSLLRVLENHEVLRVGGSHAIPVDVRIISASHKYLPKLVAEGLFRADLFYRLASLRLQVPPLREHIEDIPLLLEPLLARYGKRSEILDHTILNELCHHVWPGNVRELRSVVESYIILLGNNNTADVNLFADVFRQWRDDQTPNTSVVNPEDTHTGTLKERMGVLRKQIVQKTIENCAWDKSRAAQELGISYGTLWRILSGE